MRLIRPSINMHETEDNGVNKLHKQIQLMQQTITELQDQLLEKEKQSIPIEQYQLELAYYKALAVNQRNMVRNIRDSAIWRFSRPFRQAGVFIKKTIAKSGLIEYPKNLHFGRLPFDLRPGHEIYKDDTIAEQWRSLGDDPWFFLVPIRKETFRGWYMIEVVISSTVPHALAKFYFDYGEGFSEANTFGLLHRSGQMAKRIYRFESSPKRIRLDPLECAGLFRVDHLNFVKIPQWFACNRMISKIQRTQPEYHGLASRQILDIVKGKTARTKTEIIEKLYETYSKCFIHNQSPNTYENWIAHYEKPIFSENQAIQEEIESFSVTPLVSIILPVYDTEEKFLRRCIESVLSQSYPHWELCIADDASSKKNVGKILEYYARQDRRIKIVYRQINGHICEASNSALELSRGSYIALLDHDDELAVHALFFVVKEILKNPGAKVLYSDEDKIDENGHRFEPNFKSEWNPDQILSQNYISHLGVYQAGLVKEVGGFRKGYEGSQDYDLVLRCVPKIKDHEVIHIPMVLYHWRATEGSTALSDREKSYTTAAGLRALKDFFKEKKEKVEIKKGLSPNTFRVIYPIPAPQPLVSLLIPTRNQFDFLSRCISSILEKTTYQNYEIIVIDNQSSGKRTLNYLESIQKKENIRVLEFDRPFNFSAINNYGAAKARGHIIGLINNDIEVISPDWLTEMVAHACRPEIGCVGAKLYYSSGLIQHAGVILGIGGVAGHSHKYFPNKSTGYFSRLILTQNLSAVTGACLVVRKSLYDAVGGLNEKNLSIAFNDVDFCLKVQEIGYRNLWTPFAELYHHESVSRGAEDSREKQMRFAKEIAYMKKRWRETLTSDRYYSPHLSMVKEDFSIRSD
jgi:glycosyltransferase involved in cell wall biosynthesis